MKYLLVLFISCFAFFSFSQDEPQLEPLEDSIKGTITTIGETKEFSYENPLKYELGPIRIDGADNFDAQAIKLIAGLRQGQEITLPGEEITKAIKNLWEEELFSSVSIEVEKEVAGVVYLVIKLTPRPKLSRFKFKGINCSTKLLGALSYESGSTKVHETTNSSSINVTALFRIKLVIK